MKFSFVCLVGLALAACSSAPRAVNPDSVPAPLYYAGTGSKPYDPTLTEGERMNRMDMAKLPMVVGLAGQVLLAEPGGLPTPAGKLSVELLMKTGSDLKSIGQSMTEADGRFGFSQKLQPGSYLVRVKGRHSEGEKWVTLTDRPVTNLIIEISEKK